MILEHEIRSKSTKNNELDDDNAILTATIGEYNG